MSVTRATAAMVFIASLACGVPELEFRGQLDRIVGETVIAELVAGDPAFSGDAKIVDAENRAFSSAELKARKVDPRTVEVKIPTGIAVGPARLDLGQAGSSDRYLLPLQIGRLAMTLNADGLLQTLPLPQSTVDASQFEIGGTGKLALSPDGGLLVVLSNNQLHPYWIGPTPKKASDAPHDVEGATCIAATNDSVIVGTQDKVILLRIDKAITLEASFAVSNAQHIDVDGAGKRAVVFSNCDTDSDNQPDADCLTLIDINGPASALGAEIKLDDTPSAGIVGMRADGNAAVAADEARIYGVWLDGEAPEKAKDPLGWPSTQAKPTGIGRAPTELGDIFAISNENNNTIQLVGFQNRDLRPVGETIALGETKPTSLSFGRLADLYIASGSQLFKIDPYQPAPTPMALPLKATGNISALVVQP